MIARATLDAHATLVSCQMLDGSSLGRVETLRARHALLLSSRHLRHHGRHCTPCLGFGVADRGYAYFREPLCAKFAELLFHALGLPKGLVEYRNPPGEGSD